jgi:hypothetical protein
MEEDFGSLRVPKKSEATLCANSLNGTLHDYISLLVWVLSPDVWRHLMAVLSPSSMRASSHHESSPD